MAVRTRGRLVGRALPWIGAALVVIGIGVVHVVFAVQMRAPIVYGDELGYLDNARYLALGGQRPALTYYPGVSLALLPVWRITHDAFAVWRSAQGLNAAVALVTAVEAVVLGSVCGLGRRGRWLVAVVASAYPPVLLYSDVALAESLFQAVFVGLVLVVAVAARRRAGGALAWGLAGFLGAGLAMVHPRGFAVDVALGILALLVLRPIRQHGRQLLAGAVGLTLGLGLLRLMLVATRAANVVARTDYQAGGVVRRNLGLHAASRLVAGMVGRTFYLSVGTAGLAPFACVLGAAALVAVWRGDRRPATVVKAFTLLSTLGVTALSVLLISVGDRADELIHGRYVDGIVVPLLVIGLAELVTTRGAAWRSWVLSGTAAVVASGGLLVAATHVFTFTNELNSINVLALEPLLRASGDDLHPVSLAVVGVGVIVALGLVARRRPAAAAALVAVVFAVSAVDTQLQYLEPGSGAKARQTVLVSAIRAASHRLGLPPACVSYDGVTDFNYFADRLLLGTQRLDLLAPGAAPCGPFVITARPAFEARYPGARLVIDEDDVDEDLYVLPGPAQDRLRQAGWLLPSQTPGPLPLAGQLARIRTVSGPPASVRPGSSHEVTVRVANASPVTPWPALRGIKQGPYAVRVTARWFPVGSPPTSPGEPGVPVATSVVELPRSLLPGQAATVHLPLVARRPDGSPLPAARYQVRIVVYQELHGSFGGSLDLDLVVRSVGGASAAG